MKIFVKCRGYWHKIPLRFLFSSPLFLFCALVLVWERLKVTAQEPAHRGRGSICTVATHLLVGSPPMVDAVRISKDSLSTSTKSAACVF
jgi:hypothetical protein